jgi:hypothetical protein
MGERNNQYIENDKHRGIVVDLARCGVPQEVIADTIGVSVPTMQKYYGEVLREGNAEAISGAAKSLYAKVKEGDNASLFFYLKTRAGYKETAVVQNQYTDTNGKDLHKQDREILENAGIKQD